MTSSSRSYLTSVLIEKKIVVIKASVNNILKLNKNEKMRKYLDIVRKIFEVVKVTVVNL